MKEKIQNEFTDNLFKAILSLKNDKECEAFFEDILTISELTEIAQRLQVAMYLKKGITYQEISDKTGASTATISRVNRCLNYGAEGYATVLKRMEEKGETDVD